MQDREDDNSCKLVTNSGLISSIYKNQFYFMMDFWLEKLENVSIVKRFFSWSFSWSVKQFFPDWSFLTGATKI